MNYEWDGFKKAKLPSLRFNVLKIYDTVCHYG